MGGCYACVLLVPVVLFDIGTDVLYLDSVVDELGSAGKEWHQLQKTLTPIRSISPVGCFKCEYLFGGVPTTTTRSG